MHNTARECFTTWKAGGYTKKVLDNKDYWIAMKGGLSYLEKHFS